MRPHTASLQGTRLQHKHVRHCLTFPGSPLLHRPYFPCKNKGFRQLHQIMPSHAHLQMRMFWYDPRMWICVSARTTRVFVVFSSVNLVFPLCSACDNALAPQFQIPFMLQKMNDKKQGRIGKTPRSDLACQPPYAPRQVLASQGLQCSAVMAKPSVDVTVALFLTEHRP